MSNGPITDVNSLPFLSAADSEEIKRAAHMTLAPAAVGPEALAIAPEIATTPGEERWPVKTGQDTDAAEVGKNVIDGHNLGVGIVVTTVEELITAPRPPDMPDPRKNYDREFHSVRAKPADTPVEVTIWEIVVTVTAMTLETDGDYHLILQGASGER
jgi:hypothetical protein